MDATSIHSINAANNISMNDAENFIHKYYAQFFLSKNHADLSSVLEYDSEKQRVFHKKLYFGFTIKYIKEFWMAGIIVIFVLNDKKFPSQMNHISEHKVYNVLQYTNGA